MHGMVRSIMRITFAPLCILLVVLATVVYGTYTVTVSAPETPQDDVREAVATTTDAGSVGDTTSVPSAEESQVTTQVKPNTNTLSRASGSTSTGAQNTTLSTFVALPYDVILYSTTHYIAWSAPRGNTASLHVWSPDKKDLGPIDECVAVPTTGATQYCAWTNDPIAYASNKGYAIVLKLENSAGQHIQTVQSAPFSFMRRSELLLTPIENTTYGFALRYPDYWSVTERPEKLVVGANTDALREPGTAPEVVTVQACSTARESCAKRVDEHNAHRTRRESSVGGTRSSMVVTGSPYVRTDLVLRDGIAYFVVRRAQNAEGTVHSPYVRAVTDSFDVTKSRTSVSRYDTDNIDGSKTLLVEYTNNTVTYVRIYTGGRGCFGEIATGTFTFAEARRFDFTKGSCTISGRLYGDMYAVDEDGCSAFHGPECAFSGEYELPN